MMHSLRTSLVAILLCLSIIACTKRETVYRDNMGHSIQLTHLQNKWLVVNYWASWCPSCVREIPELNKFYQHSHDKIIMLGVNYDLAEEESLDKAIQKSGIIFPVLTMDPAKDWHLGYIEAIPATFILNPKGEVVKKIEGETTDDDLTNLIRDLQQDYKPS